MRCPRCGSPMARSNRNSKLLRVKIWLWYCQVCHFFVKEERDKDEPTEDRKDGVGDY